MRLFLSFGLFLVIFCLSSRAESQPVNIDYFYEAGCPDCAKVRDQVLPELQERFEGFYILQRHDVNIITNIIRLVAYQEKLQIKKNEPVMMVVDCSYVLNGFDAIKTGLLARVDECVAERLAPGWVAPEPIKMPTNGVKLAETRLQSFTLSMVAIGGFSDGINPCAIGTLVFFMSLLTMGGVRGRGVVIMGLAFCVASFVTYTAIGYGLLRIIHTISGFEFVRNAVEYGVMAVLLIFAFLSFRDAARYNNSGNAGDVTLQLPLRIKLMIHNVLKEGTRKRSLFIGGLTAGVLVTLLESVCTGQVYVPTLVLVAQRGDAGSGMAWWYLLLYNAMFMLPLVVVFVLTLLGLRTEKLVDWSRANVVPSKVLLGLFFLSLALAMLWL